MPQPTLDERSFLTAVRTLGTGRAISISLSDDEMCALVEVILHDLGARDLALDMGAVDRDVGSYFERPLSSLKKNPFKLPFWEVFYAARAQIQDFVTYFKCLCEMHKRRVKYDLILSRQPMPTSDQIAPRVLLEYGATDAAILATWMTWRKWLFDLDNRAGQETGYLFEPILAASLGGVSYGASKSPIRRRGDAAKGRQVDCIVDRDAYEFKIRVTIAASGQGRFAEELTFVEDCVASDYRPVLIVLDPTSNPRLGELSRAFVNAGGVIFIGEDAWAHLEERAGPTMATFLEQYVRRPISQIAPLIGTPMPMTLQVTQNGNIELGFDTEAGRIAKVLDRQEGGLDEGE